jgi:hypothetical protein
MSISKSLTYFFYIFAVHLNMKKLFIFTAVAVSLFACDKITNATFSQTHTSGEFKVPDNLAAGDYIDTIDLDIDLVAAAQANGTSLDLLKEIKLTSAKAIAITGNFDNFDNLSATFLADGLPNTLVMSKDPIEAPTTGTLDMDVNTTNDFLTQFKASGKKLIIKGKLKAATTEEQAMKFEIGYNVKAGI